MPVQKIKSKKDIKTWITKEIKRENTKKHNLYNFFLQNQTEAAKHLHQKHCRKKIIGRALVFLTIMRHKWKQQLQSPLSS